MTTARELTIFAFSAAALNVAALVTSANAQISAEAKDAFLRVLVPGQQVTDCGWATSENTTEIVRVPGLDSGKINGVSFSTIIAQWSNGSGLAMVTPAPFAQIELRANNGTPSAMIIPRVGLTDTNQSIHHVLLKDGTVYVAVCDYTGRSQTIENCNARPDAALLSPSQVRDYLASLTFACNQYFAEATAGNTGDPSARGREKAARDTLMRRFTKDLRTIGAPIQK